MRIKSAGLLLAGVLAACGAQSAVQNLAASSLARAHGGSWMAGKFENSDLLYVDDDGNDQIDVFTYPEGKAVGQIEYGSLRSDGLCSDKRGHVFVPGYEQSKIFEFAHGGTQPVATLEMAGYEFPRI